jgi:low affinity Fe/Cu permease
MSSHSYPSLAKAASRFAGRPSIFLLAVTIIVIWAVTGPLFHFSDTWQLVINTGTTIVTFLMVFLIQNTQNRDGAAMQIKLDELIRALQGAHNELVDLEDMSDRELEQVKAHYTQLAEKARTQLQERPRERDEDQAETGSSRGSGNAATKASTASGSS